ncbi:unnamed protein product [Colias eurytheme]|nr:unnamed protein product [Colias eurytheme]
MAANYLINVPKLRGRENYSEWCFAAENFLILEGMKHCVKPEGASVGAADDEKTRAKLIMTIDSSFFVHVKSVRTSKELWEKLQQLFDDNGFSRRINLLRNLISIRLENSSMTSYVTQIIDTAQKLSGTGFEINDQWTGSLLLAGLPERFSPKIMATEHSGINITADSIKSKLLDMESTIEEHDEVGGAFAARLKYMKNKMASRKNVNVGNIVDPSKSNVKVKTVTCLTYLATNLLSVSQLISKGNKVSFSDSSCSIYNKNNELVATAILKNGVYKVNLENQEFLAASVVSGVTWHRRLGHINKDYLNQMKTAVQGMSFDEKLDIGKSSCATCCEGKQCRLPFKSTSHRSSDLLDIVHTDICGPMENVSIGGSRYFLLFVDDCSRMVFVYFLKHKNEALKCFKEFKAQVENQTKKTIKVLRSDNGLEYCNKEFDNYLKGAGIIHQKTNPYTPQQNGLCERFNRTIVEKARCLLFDANLGKEFWGEATNTAVYLQNRSVAAALGNKTPYEIWTGCQPDISHIRIFGSTAMVHVAKEKRKKWDKKSEKCILLGYPENTKGYRLYNPETKKILTSRDVVIIEQESKSECQMEVSSQSFDSVGEEVKINELNSESENTDSSEDTFLDVVDETYKPSDSEADEVPQIRSQRPTRERKQPDRFKFSNFCTGGTTYDDVTGLSLQDALAGPEKEQWKMAMAEELQSFKENDAWELSNPPQDVRVVQCKWVLRKKYDCDNNIRFRARLVARGFSQVQGVDYTETFSPVVRHTTLRLLFALSVQNNLDITHLDVTTAFLYGILEEDIYIQIPEGFSETVEKGQVLKLKKSMYGLKQSSRVWYKRVEVCLLKIGFVKSKIEPCMFLKKQDKLKTIVALYVDDFFIFSNDSRATKQLKDVLSDNFKIKDLGEIKKCLGVNVKVNKSEKTISISQEDYIEQLLLKFNMSQCKTVQTPMENGNSVIEGFVDADWGGNTVDRRSYTGFCFTLSGCVISWETKKQKTVALSSSEAEYMALTEACKESLYLRNLQFEITNKKYTIELYNDNQSAIKLTQNPIFHKRTKHIDIRYHFCRDCVTNNIVNVKYLPSAEMPADLLTKSLCSNKHYYLLDKLGVQHIYV